MDDYTVVVIVMKPDKVFDCVLDGKIFYNVVDAEKAIKDAKKEDKVYGWDYSYKIEYLNSDLGE